MELEGLNYFAVLVAWVVNCVIGAVWYSPVGFAKHWARITGVDIMKFPEKEATSILISVVLSGLVQALALGIVLNSLKVDNLADGLLTGVVLWFGFTTATMVGVTLYQRRGWDFLWLNSAYFFVVMGINSIILSLWK